MKKRLLAGVIAASVALAACNEKQADKGADAEKPAASQAAAYETVLQKVSYGIGLNIAKNLSQQGVEFDQTAFQDGLKDGFSGADAKVSPEALQQAMQEFQKQQMEKQMADRKAAEDKNKAESAKFLEENGQKDGVVTTESGLQYKVITKSDSDKKPAANDTVVVHYRGTLINGEEFDSSYSRNQPATFNASAVIPGWTEALQLMSVGDKFELYIPSELAYGAGGAGPKIGPHSALIFEVELLEIKDSEQPAEAK